MIIETIPVGPLKVNCYLIGCEETAEGGVVDAAACRDFGLEAEDSPAPDCFLEDGMQIRIGRYVLQVIHTPGHSLGGCCFWCESEEVVFTEDTLFNGDIGRVDLPGGSLFSLHRAIRERLYVFGDSTRVFPGHGTSTTIGRERLNNPMFPVGGEGGSPYDAGLTKKKAPDFSEAFLLRGVVPQAACDTTVRRHRPERPGSLSVLCHPEPVDLTC
jgi:hypothetical protein